MKQIRDYERLVYFRAKERLQEIMEGKKSTCPLKIGIPNEREVLEDIIEKYKYLESD